MIEPDAPLAAWPDGTLVAAILAVSPGGLAVRCRLAPGTARDSWLSLLQAGLLPNQPVRRAPAALDDDRLLGGLDLSASLAARRRVARAGLLDEAAGGVLVLSAPERLPPHALAHLAALLDDPGTEPPPAGLVLLDETVPDDPPLSAMLADRLAFTVGDLPPMRGADPLAPPSPFPLPPGYAARLQRARTKLPFVAMPLDLPEAFCAAASAAGIVSLRAPVLALRVARIVAALEDAGAVTPDHAAIAARLVLAPRAAMAPPEPAASEAPPGNVPEDRPDAEAGSIPPESSMDDKTDPTAGASDSADTDQAAGTDLAGTVLAALRTSLPTDLLDRLRPQGGIAARAAEGRSEAARTVRARPARRGRPIGARPGDPSRGRLDVLATLRAALPWQSLRGDRADARIQLRRADLHVTRFAPRLRMVTIFLVDASGSAARARLAEAKGSVSVLLAECYADRDQVALVACRNRAAEVLLPPTGSVVRARRTLDSLPGGGGTPLAAGIEAALALAHRIRREGGTPRLVLFTDGRANVARDGTADRDRAMRDALSAATLLRAAALPSLLVEISARPGPAAPALAQALGARLLLLPRNEPETVARAAASLGCPSAAPRGVAR
ncbi:VWA domain-containing protein [Acetobacteraceae bacterium KSS8]|uniref:VWA domain-containing protein n=1 Tax=Endosaccharibacter trunci TaxID=2812733 RepID=A0ABT1W3N2_9PROT|nr:VWA domain-containing protein [Acetobacteraceae bacterium KSS8]